MSLSNYFLYSNKSPGWQSNALQIASRVESRIARAFPFFRIEIFAIVIPTFSVSSVTLIFRFASITSMLMIIAIVFQECVKKSSDTRRQGARARDVQAYDDGASDDGNEVDEVFKHTLIRLGHSRTVCRARSAKDGQVPRQTPRQQVSRK